MCYDSQMFKREAIFKTTKNVDFRPILSSLQYLVNNNLSGTICSDNYGLVTPNGLFSAGGGSEHGRIGIRKSECGKIAISISVLDQLINHLTN